MDGQSLKEKNLFSIVTLRHSLSELHGYIQFMETTMLRLFKEKESIRVVNDQYGCPTHAADLAGIIMNFIEDMENNIEYAGIVNYCNSGITTWFDFALAIKEFVNSSCKIIPVSTSQYPTAAKRPQYSVLDTSKSRKMFKTDIPFWKDSLQKCLDLLTENN